MSNCPYCGPKTITHFQVWLENSLAIALTPIDKFLLENPIHKTLRKLGRPLQKPTLRILELAKILSYNSNPEKIQNIRAKVIFEEALKRSIPIKSIRIFDNEVDYYLATVNNQEIIFNGFPRPSKSIKPGFWWMDDKKILKTKLSEIQIPIPKGENFSKLKPALKYFDSLEKPVVVKPQLGSRGRHTTTFIYTPSQLEQAFRVAKQLCHWVLVEEHLKGSVYRGTVIGGKLVGVLGGDPPKITGDGRHTVRELIKTENSKKPETVKTFVPTPATPEFLSRLGFSFDSVIPEGQTIDLTEKIGVSYGGTSFEVTRETHPEFKKYLERAATLIDDPFLGFDFITKNVKESPENQRWGIIEVNSLPFINLHHFPLIGKPVNIAKYVWDYAEKVI